MRREKLHVRGCYPDDPHGSKGLEFPAVFIYGAREGNIPLENEKRPSDEEEERRLLYVGMTRAKES